MIGKCDGRLNCREAPNKRLSAKSSEGRDDGYNNGSANYNNTFVGFKIGCKSSHSSEGLKILRLARIRPQWQLRRRTQYVLLTRHPPQVTYKLYHGMRLNVPHSWKSVSFTLGSLNLDCAAILQSRGLKPSAHFAQ